MPWNVHACTHIGDSLLAFGPSLETWLYPYERTLSGVAALSFSRKRIGIDTTAATAFRLNMFTMSSMQLVMDVFADHMVTGLVKHAIKTTQTVEPSRGKMANSPVIQSMSDFNAHLYDLGLAQDHPDMNLVLYSPRTLDVRKLTSTPIWLKYLKSYITQQQLTLIEDKPISCYRKVTFDGVPFVANPDTWTLHEDLSIEVSDMNIPRGSCVSVRFFAKNREGKEVLEEYFGEIQSFVEAWVVCREGTEQELQLMLVYWRKFKNIPAPKQQKSLSALMRKQADHASSKQPYGDLGPPTSTSLIVENSAFLTDQFTPISRIGGRVAFIPVYKPDSQSFKAGDPRTISHYRIMRLPWAL